MEKNEFYDLIEFAKEVQKIRKTVSKYKDTLKEYNESPKKEKTSSFFGASLLILFAGEIIIGIIWFILYIIFSLVDGLFLRSLITNEKTGDKSNFIHIFNVVTLILCIIYGVGVVVYSVISRIKENKEYRIQLKEFKEMRECSQLTIREVNAKLESTQNKLNDLESEFIRQCNKFSIPECYRSYYKLEEICDYGIDNYTNETVEQWIERYQEHERLEEHFREMESEICRVDHELEMQRLEKKAEREKARRKWGSDEEPELYSDFYDTNGNHLRYKYTDPLGNAVMEDENGNEVDVRTGFNGRIRRKDNGDYVDRL